MKGCSSSKSDCPEDLLVVIKRRSGHPELLPRSPKGQSAFGGGEPVGQIIVKIDGETKVTADLVAESAVEESGFFRFLWQIGKSIAEGFFR